MGRTFEALSHTRIKNHLPMVEVEEIPPTAIVPVFPQEIGRASTATGIFSPQDDQASSDTALMDELSKDNDGIPFIEVGPKGSLPTYGPMVALTPVPNPAPLRLNIAPPIVAMQKTEPPIISATFFPISPRVESGKSIANDLIAFHRPEHPVSATYRGLLAGIATQHAKTVNPLLVFTTVGYEAEAASVILNLAITRAREEKRRILVVEANHERPLIADRLGSTSLPGLRELLNRSVPMAVALHETKQANLFLLPPGDPDLPVSEEAEARLPSLMQHIRNRFDWVIVNGPEWGSGGIAEWANLGDAVYLVVGAGQWDTPEVEAAHEAIVLKGGKLRGYITLRKV